MSSYIAKAYFSEERFDLIRLQSLFDQAQLLKKERSFILLKLDHSQYLYVKDYGAIVFFGIEEKLQAELLSEISASTNVLLSDHTEAITVEDGHSKLESNFDVLHVDKIDLEIVHIICLNLSQSVALFYYQALADGLLQNTHLHTKELESKGRVSLRRKKLLKYIGSVLNIRNRISENLFVFDTPMIAWDDEKIGKIDSKLNEELEIKYRYNAIKEQLNIIKENLDLFKDLNLHQHSSILEWIIIWLILFEVVHVIIDQLLLK